MRKPLSVTMAGLLALLLVPVVPGASQAHAEGGAASAPYGDFVVTATDDAGIATAGVLNNHAAGSVAFEQRFDKDAIMAALSQDAQGSAGLAKPVIDSSDATLKAAAEKAAKDGVEVVAKNAAAAHAEADLASKTALVQDAKNAGATAAAEVFAKPENENKALEAAKAKAEKAHPGCAISEVVIKTKPNDNSLDVTPALGEPVMSVKESSAIASDAAILPDTAAFANDDAKLVWALDESAFAVDIANAVADNEGVVAIGSTAQDVLTLDVKGAGATNMKVPFTYGWNVTGGAYQCAYGYKLSYTPSYEFESCTYSFDFTYTYEDENGAKQTGQAGKIETSDNFTLDEKPAGDLAEVGNIAISGAAAEGEFTLDAPYTPQDANFDGTGSYDYAIEVTNLYTDSFQETAQHAFTGDDAFTYNDAAKTVQAFDDQEFAADQKAAALQFLGEPAITETNGFAVSYDKAAGTLTVAPKNATDPAGESVTVTWTLPDGAQVVHTVTAAVNPLEISYNVAGQPFRLEPAQQQRVLDAANANVRAAVNAIEQAAGRTDITADYYASVSFASYDGQGAAAQSPSLAFKKGSNAGAYANYRIVDLGNVNVAKMEGPAWKDTGLQLTATHGSDSATLTADNAASQWINSKPTASWAGYRLAYATKGVPASESAFAGSSELSGGDGIHEVELYAMDDDGRVCQVTGVSYMLDTQAPTLKGSEASAPQKAASFGGILFGDTFVNVDLTVADERKSNEKDSADKLRSIESGVDVSQTKAWYTDVEGGRSIEASLNKDKAPLYSFTIQGDKDVPVSSIAVQAVDNAGNVLNTTADKAVGAPMEYQRLVADAAAPQMAVEWDTYDARNGRYYQTNRTMTVTITDAFFNYVIDYENDQVITTVSQNGEAVIAVHPSDFTEVSTNMWQYTLSFTVDADWDVSTLRVADIVGRPAEAAGDSFTVDKTNPTMDVSFDNNNVANGMYYNAARTATVTVTEHNFSGNLVNINPTADAGNGDAVGSPAISGWSSSGDVHTATVTFPGEGVYSMTIDGMDQAQNALASYSCEQFVVDTVKPEVSIVLSGGDATNLEGIAPVRGEAGLQVSVTDTNVDSSTDIAVVANGLNKANPYRALSRSETATSVTVECADPAQASENDGVYTLNVSSVDKAGNTETKSVSWSVNRFGSTYMLVGDTDTMLDKFMPSSGVRDVVVREINPSGLEKQSVELSKGMSVSTLSEGSQYEVDAQDFDGWHQYDYTVKKSNFNSDGQYAVLLSSTDKAGNVSDVSASDANENREGSVSIAFAVDDTPPTCDFLNLDKETYDEAGHTAQVSIGDNILLKGASIKVTDESDAVTFEKKLDDKDLTGGASSVHDIVLPESNSFQEVVVTATDAAGNTHSDTRRVLVTTDVFARVSNNPPLLVGCIVGGVAILGLAGAGVGFAVRKRKLGSADTGRAA